MKNLLIIIILSISFSLLNCSTEPEGEYQEYQIKVDKVTLSDTISVHDTLSLKFDGFVGPNGCHRFKYFAVVNKSNEITIAVLGEKPTFSSICTDQVIYLDGKEYKLKLAASGNYKIKINQPDNTSLIDSVYVK